MFGNMKNMMQQAQQMQFKLAELQEKFKEILVEGEAGGGLVKITMTCGHVVKSIEIDPSLLGSDDKETLEDLVAAAMNNVMQAKDAKVKEETASMMEAMGMPPGMMGDGGFPF